MSVRTPNVARCRKLIRLAIEAFEVDLSGLTVLTEAANGAFVTTPLTAALAGAARVYAVARDSRYGSAAEVTELTLGLADHWDIPSDRIEILRSRADPRITEADLITNLGFVRPLDRPFLERLGPTAAITLMFETWEHRDADVDLAGCRELGIPVLGTNEEDPRLQTFRYLPALAAKLLFEINVEVFGAHLVLVSSGKFAREIGNGLSSMGARLHVFAPPLPRRLAEFERALADADAVIVADHPGSGPILGGAAAYAPSDLLELNAGIGLVHVSGDVDPDDVAAAGLPLAPEHIAPVGHMSVTTDYVGPRPIIDLHAAGLKVGEALTRARHRGLEGREAEESVLAGLPLSQGFPEHSGVGA